MPPPTRAVATLARACARACARARALPDLPRAAAARPFSTTGAPRADFAHAVRRLPALPAGSPADGAQVVGGGVVGLAVAAQLARRAPASTLLLERHGALGTETTARNSEVVHAGLYYAPASLKARLCVRGRALLYALCAARRVAHARPGKWIVAQTRAQRDALAAVERRARALGVPVRWVAEAEVRRAGEGVCAAAGALESPETGIVDAHGLVAALHGLLDDAGGLVALGACVTGVEPLGGGDAGCGGWRLAVRDAASGRTSFVTAETLVNAAGLGAAAVHNMAVPPARRRRLYYAKGNYFSYAAPRPRVSRLVYPAPDPDAAGLGTHLTLDLAGRLRFGPDVEWVDAPDDLAVSPARLAAAAAEIRRYLPALDAARLAPDYAGIRPKLAGPGAGFRDFYIRCEPGYAGWVNLLGIESPGLTSSLAIAEEVERLLYGSVSPPLY